jgi:hypothetical protein
MAENINGAGVEEGIVEEALRAINLLSKEDKLKVLDYIQHLAVFAEENNLTT